MLNVSVDLQVPSAVDSDCVMSPLPGLVYYLQRYYLIKILIHYANDFSVHFSFELSTWFVCTSVPSSFGIITFLVEKDE